MSRATEIFGTQRGRIIATLGAFTKVLGPAAGIFLSQALYWQRHPKVGDYGWFFQTQKQWDQSCGLTRRNTTSARKKLIARGLIREERRGVTGKLYFQVDLDAVERLLGTSTVCEVSTPDDIEVYDDRVCEVSTPECTERALHSVRFAHAKRKNLEKNLEKKEEKIQGSYPESASLTPGETASPKKAKTEEAKAEAEGTKKEKKGTGKKKTSTLPQRSASFFNPVEPLSSPRVPIKKQTDFGPGGPPRLTELPAFKWPPERPRDAYWFWAAEVQAANPGYAPTFPGADQAKVFSIAKKLLERCGHYDTFASIVRVAVWDWRAIQEEIHPWYTKDRAVPLINDIAYLHPQLAAKLKNGVVSKSLRVSRYRQRFGDKTPQAEERADGLTLAQAHHKMLREKHAAAKQAAKQAAAQTG